MLSVFDRFSSTPAGAPENVRHAACADSFSRARVDRSTIVCSPSLRGLLRPTSPPSGVDEPVETPTSSSFSALRSDSAAR